MPKLSDIPYLISYMLGPGQPELHFWFISFVVVISAIGVVSSKNLVHAAMLLALCLVSVAGIFILLNAEVLAAVQVLVYAGGIVVLIIFAIMLSESIVGHNIVAHNRQSVTVLGVAVLMAILMVAILMFNDQGQFVGPTRWMLSPNRNQFPEMDNVHLIGRSLMTTYTLAFWVVSALLTIAMIGALIIARHETDMIGSGKLSTEEKTELSSEEVCETEVEP